MLLGFELYFTSHCFGYFITNMRLFIFNFLFNASIEENVVLDKEIQDEELKKIIDTSSLKTFIEKKEFNYKEIIEENNANISGGQIQRIGIARALYISPQILVLDEATSALDIRNEENILKLIGKFNLKTKSLFFPLETSELIFKNIKTKKNMIFFFSEKLKAIE